MIVSAATPKWRLLRNQIGPTDRPHHIANRLLKALGVARPPVDVRTLAVKLGITVWEVQNPGWSGAIRSTENTAIIWINFSEALVRQRFTLAHELGHLFQHPLGMEFRDVTFAGSPKESEANNFAADLLIPLWMLDGYAAAFNNNVESLARAFDVSAHAMQIQLDKHKGYPVRW